MPTKRKGSHVYVKRLWLAQIRSSRGLTQEQVADAMGVSAPSYNQIENGKQGQFMNSPKLLALSAILGVGVERICHLEAEYQAKVDRANGKTER